MSDLNTRTIDHLVHLTPPATVEEVTQKFKEIGFMWALRSQSWSLRLIKR